MHLKVKGITIGKLRVKLIPVIDVDIFGFWDTYNKKTLKFKMDPDTDYALYCNVESSEPEGTYDIYIDPVLKKDLETHHFISGPVDTYDKMIPHSSEKTWYVKSFEWFPHYKNLREPGKYHIILKVGYLKKDAQFGTKPNWQEPEEFIVNLT